MKWLNRARLRLSRLARRRRLDRDLEDELRFHLEMMGPDRAGAQRQFGNYTRLKEACREMWTLGSIEIWLQDLRYSLRMLRRSPGFTVVAVVALALGIGVNTTVFSLANGALYKNLPFADSDRILYLSSVDRSKGWIGDLSFPDFQDLQSQMKSFDRIAATNQTSGDISDGAALPQRQEIGVRVAMGAKMADVLRLVLSQGMRQLAIGLAIGLPAALAVTRAMAGVLAGVSPSDPLTYITVTLILTAAGILGCAIPARRAIRVDPAITLRHE